MKNWFVCVLFFMLCGKSIGQSQPNSLVKPTITVESSKKWAYVDGGIISNDGNYASYTIGKEKLIVEDTKSSWKTEFTYSSSFRFTNDSRVFILKIGRDSIALFDLFKKTVEYISNVSDYQTPENDNGVWFAYSLVAPTKKLVLVNMHTGKEQCFDSVENFSFSRNGKFIVFEQKRSIETELECLNLNEGKLRSIWTNSGREEKLSSWVYDADERQLVFIVQRKQDAQFVNELWYNDLGNTGLSYILVNSKTQYLGNEMGIINISPKFSKSGNRLFFTIQDLSQRPKLNENVISVDIWNYQDRELQSLQSSKPKFNPFCTAVVNIESREVFRLEFQNERLVNQCGDWALIVKEFGYEAYWNANAQISWYLVSLKDGTRKLLKANINNAKEVFHLSPQGRWVVYYDFEKNNYFSYEIKTGITRNITKNTFNIWTDEENDMPEKALPDGNICWLADDEAVLISDSYDLWIVDPKGLVKPSNFTNHYGRNNQLKFLMLNSNDLASEFSVANKSMVFFKAFNKLDKNWGFYSKHLGSIADPDSLTMGPYLYGRWGGQVSYNEPPAKAKNNNIWLMKRMSATEAPNYFITQNFKSFKRLSNIEPQKDYNWLTTELITWKRFDGKLLQGILYKPENFNSKKKYPIIFQYYEKRSGELNLYPDVRASEGRINIPLFVSAGYLVFVPDIKFNIGEPGNSALTSIVSAADFLSKKPFVDKNRIGIQGHSWGGYETNYIVTHTKIFAAACAVSGVSDLISLYGSYNSRGSILMYHAEKGQGRMGTTLWSRPDLYIRNSPIFKANEVSTPLLLVNNKGDNVVPFSQGVEFFTALRRLDKKVWMLQYDEGSHEIGGKASEDFHLRMMQFFDFYLRGSHAPNWMIDGIPANMKGVSDGLQLDTLGVRPGPGLSKKHE